MQPRSALAHSGHRTDRLPCEEHVSVVNCESMPEQIRWKTVIGSSTLFNQEEDANPGRGCHLIRIDIPLANPAGPPLKCNERINHDADRDDDENRTGALLLASTSSGQVVPKSTRLVGPSCFTLAALAVSVRWCFPLPTAAW